MNIKTLMRMSSCFLSTLPNSDEFTMKKEKRACLFLARPFFIMSEYNRKRIIRSGSPRGLPQSCPSPKCGASALRR